VSYIDSGKTHPREERNRRTVVVHKPLKVLLKHTLSIHTKGRQNSIQTGFGSSRLPTAIEQLNVCFTDTSNQIAMQVDIRNMSAADDFGVVELEVLAVSDGSIHQSFDLTHGVGSFDSLKIERIGGFHKGGL